MRGKKQVKKVECTKKIEKLLGSDEIKVAQNLFVFINVSPDILGLNLLFTVTVTVTVTVNTRYST